MEKAFSNNPKRNEVYLSFLRSCREKNLTVGDLIKMGASLMKQARLHHHFFADQTLNTTAMVLASFALKLPYDPTNIQTYDFLNQIISDTQAQAAIVLFERRIQERIP